MASVAVAPNHNPKGPHMTYAVVHPVTRVPVARDLTEYNAYRKANATDGLWLVVPAWLT